LGAQRYGRNTERIPKGYRGPPRGHRRATKVQRNHSRSRHGGATPQAVIQCALCTYRNHTESTPVSEREEVVNFCRLAGANGTPVPRMAWPGLWDSGTASAPQLPGMGLAFRTLVVRTC
jgi:hypothetical protein